MSAADNAPSQQPISPATSAAWRRMREASLEPQPARADAEPGNGLHATATLPQPVPAPRLAAVAPPLPVTTAPLPPAATAARPPVAPPRVPAAAPQPGRARRPRGRIHRFARSPGFVLLCILAVQAGLSLRIVWSNTAFMDEALYLWAGHLEIAHLLYGSAIPAFPAYFSGAPVIYPVVGAIADSYGGLALARILSLAFMLGATALLYAVTGRLFGRRAALGAAAIFAVLGPVQVLGAFATFDAMSVFLLALCTWLVVRAQGRLSEPLLLAAGLVLAVANATKYASALWDPVIIALAALTAGEGGPLRSATRAARLTGYVAGALAIAVFRFGGQAYAQGVLFTTLQRQAGGTSASALTVLRDSFNWVGIVFILAAIGLGISFTEGVRTRLLCGTLLAAILLAPAEQARIHILTSLHKHVAFGAWFAAIVAGYALARASRANKARGWRVLAAAAGVAAFLGIPQATTMYSGWPNSARMVADLAPVISQTHCPCLVAENNVVTYYLLRQTLFDRIAGPFSFYQWDQSSQRVLRGIPAYRQAIANHYFRVAEIDPDENPAIYEPVAGALAAAHGWQLIDRIPSGTRREPIEIWRYAPGRSGNEPYR